MSLSLSAGSLPADGTSAGKRELEAPLNPDSEQIAVGKKRARTSGGKEETSAAKTKNRRVSGTKQGADKSTAPIGGENKATAGAETFESPTKGGSPSDGQSVASTVKVFPTPSQAQVDTVAEQNHPAAAAQAEPQPSSLLPHFSATEGKGGVKPKKSAGPKKRPGVEQDGKTKKVETKSVTVNKPKTSDTKTAKDPLKKGKAAKKAKDGVQEKPAKPKKRPSKDGAEESLTKSDGAEVQDSALKQEDAVQVSVVPNAISEESDEKDGEWRTSGSHFLGRRVVRTFVNDTGFFTPAFATVIGWLPAAESDFCNDAGVPAALWHILYEDRTLGEEDLEEHEIEEAVRAFELSAKSAVDVGSASLQAQIDRILVDAPFHIVQREGTKVGEVAKELGINVQDLILLNSHRYGGLKSGSRLKRDTLLFFSKEKLDHGLTAKPLAVAFTPKKAHVDASAPMEVESAAAKPPPSKPVSEAPQSVLNAVVEQEAAEPRADWHFAQRPVLEFPPYPGVTEADGPLMARKFRCGFTCPFKTVDGVVYATPGFEAVAPITATVEDSWAECDACKKWRRLPPTLVVGEGAEFNCADIGRSCQDAEDDWDDGEEIEVANDTMKTIEAKLPLQLGDLTVTVLGDVLPDKAGYWNRSYIFPVGYECTRKYVTDEESRQKTEFVGQIEAGDDGPVFRVTPKGEDGQLLQNLSRTGKTARSAWVSVLSLFKIPSLSKTTDKDKEQQQVSDDEVEEDEEEVFAAQSVLDREFVDAENLESLPVEVALRELDGMGSENVVSLALEPERAPQTDVGAADDRPIVMEIEGAQPEVAEGGQHEQSDRAGRAASNRRKQEEEEEDGGKQKKTQINGNALFGFGLARVIELIESLPGAEEIIATRDELRRKESKTLSVTERMRDMPKHLFADPNARVPIRNRANGHILIGKDAPKRKNILKYLKENVSMEAIDPSKLSKADMAGLQGASQVHICWDCKKGMFASKKNTKIICRFQLGHTGPDWKNDPRAKSDKSMDPFAHVRLPASFKYRWKEGCIVTLDYNKQGAPTLVRMPKEFVQDALQVDISWQQSVDEDGWPVTEAHLEPREQETAKRAPRKIYRRPPLPVTLPENPSGCARAEAWVRKSFTDKAEFTHMAQPHFPRLLSQSDYTSMSDARKFQWMKENQNQRLAIGNSGIEGYGIFARRPIYKGEMVVEYTGEAIRPVLADLREERYESAGIGTYFWRLEEHVGAGEPLEGRAAIVDATVKHNIGHYINHCCDPNCEAKITRISGQRRIIIFAIHDIEFGEELTYDYKLPFEDNKIPCHCGANACRGTLN